MADILTEIRERHDHAKNAWQDIRKEAATDMAFVSGDPWDEDDKKHRKGRPTIAPEEMGQYFNQVINQLWANPRGMKFAPVGNGANDKTAEFYQNKAREIEYRSHAKIAYTTAASDAIQRSYGFVRVTTRYANPRSANQEIWIDPCPDPDMVTPDADAKRADSSDQQFCFVEEWADQNEFKRSHPKAKIKNFSEWAGQHQAWISGNKVLQAEYWTISTRPRQLVLVQPIAPPQQRMIAPSPTPAVPEIQVFADEVPAGGRILRDLRKVDYPQVRMYLTNGIEILHEQDWPGKFIPIISCYGKVLYVPKSGETKKHILSMTRFGRAPWKAYCYAASQQLEVISMIPKAPFMVPRGTFPGPLATAVQEAMHTPKAFLEYDPKPNGAEMNGPPMRADYPAGQHLQALEIVKEGFRRAIQSAMGSNFLPTDAQNRSQKSGKALDKIEQNASTGTFHFVNNYNDMIRQVGVVCEDLIDKIYDFAGETGVMEPDGTTASMVAINSDAKDAISTKGDHLVTISEGPSSDSEREAVQEFTDGLVQNLQQIAQVSGPKAAAAVFARAIRMRNGGPMMDELADIIEPPEFKSKDGEKPPDPAMLALQGQVQQMQQQLQQASQIIQTEQVKAETEKAIKGAELETRAATERLKIATSEQVARMQADASERETAFSNLVKLAIAELQAKTADAHDHADSIRDALGRSHELGLAAADAQQEAAMADMGHQHAVDQTVQTQALDA